MAPESGETGSALGPVLGVPLAVAGGLLFVGTPVLISVFVGIVLFVILICELSPKGAA